MNYEWQVLSYIWICDKTKQIIVVPCTLDDNGIVRSRETLNLLEVTKQMIVVPCTLDDNGIVRSRETLNLLDVIIPLFSAGGIP